MADTTYFRPESTLGRPVRDLLDNEVKERLALLEVQLNTDRDDKDANTAALTSLTTELAKVAAGDMEYTADQAITNNTAFDLFTVPVADENGVCLLVEACVFVDDGTDHQMVALSATIVAVNKGGTVSATVAEREDDEVLAESSGGSTLTLAIAAAEGADNVLDVSITANSSLTPTTIQVSWRATVLGSSAGVAITKVNADA